MTIYITPEQAQLLLRIIKASTLDLDGDEIDAVLTLESKLNMVADSEDEA